MTRVSLVVDWRGGNPVVWMRAILTVPTTWACGEAGLVRPQVRGCPEEARPHQLVAGSLSLETTRRHSSVSSPTKHYNVAGKHGFATWRMSGPYPGYLITKYLYIMVPKFILYQYLFAWLSSVAIKYQNCKVLKQIHLFSISVAPNDLF